MTAPTTPDTALERPARACVLCPPPRTQAWRLADAGYKTCTSCYDRFRDLLKDVVRRWLMLNPRPGANGEHGSRGAPGFGSRSPASDHVIAMRDRRISSVARTWLGRDGRLHQESERPPLSAHNVLDSIAWEIAEHRDIGGPDGLDVHELAEYIDRNLDWTCRHDLIADHHAALREFASQLRPVTGDPKPRYVALCPVVIDEGDHTRECGARLYAPLRGDEIHCRSCDERWPRSEWLRLGNLLEAG